MLNIVFGYNAFKSVCILSMYMYFLGCSCASASVHTNPDRPQQMAWWLRGCRGRRVFTAAWICMCMMLRVSVNVFFVCVCLLTHTCSQCSLFPLQAVCGVFDKSVRTLLHDFGPMVAQLSEMLGQIYSAFPQASALDLARQVCPHRSGPEWKHYWRILLLGSEAILFFFFFFFRWCTYLLERNTTSLTSKTLLKC